MDQVLLAIIFEIMDRICAYHYHGQSDVGINYRLVENFIVCINIVNEETSQMRHMF